MKKDISCVILVKNEKENLRKCIASVKNFEDIIVVDDNSVDGSNFLAKDFGIKLFQRRFDNLDNQRMFGATKAKRNWILFLDADEQLTTRGRKEIEKTVFCGQKEFYAVPRENIVLGKSLRYGNWYPNYQVRIMKRNKICFRPVRKEVGYLEVPLKHYSHQNLLEWWRKYWRATSVQASIKKDLPIFTLTRSIKDVWQRLIKYKGYKDGVVGIATIFYLPIFSITVILKRLWRKLWSH